MVIVLYDNKALTSRSIQHQLPWFLIPKWWILTGASIKLSLSTSGGYRILSISWMIPFTLRSSLFVTFAWLMKTLPWKKKPNTKCPNNRNKTEECLFIIKHRFGLCLLAGFINIDINLLNQLRADLGDAGGQHESRQRCQVSWLAQVSSQESVTHDDVAAQDISVPLSLPSHLKDKITNLLISDSSWADQTLM